MAVLRKFGKRWRRVKQRPAFTLAEETLRGRVEAFASATTLSAQTHRFGVLLAYIWTKPGDRAFIVSLLRFIRLLELDKDLRVRFDAAWQSMLTGLDSVSLFADAGLPTHNGLWRESFRRIFQRLLPSAREDSDTAKLFTAIFSSPKAVERFVNLKDPIFNRLVRILWPSEQEQTAPRVEDDIAQALSLLATRVAGRGVTAAVRQRGSIQKVEESPFYKLVFATETLLRSDKGEARRLEMRRWLDAVHLCRTELIHVHLHMEDAGVSTALVFDLTSMEASLDRMQLLAATLTGDAREVIYSSRQLLNTLVAGRQEDTQLGSLVRQNLNLLARKTVERTGHSGEHYIANNRKEYWQMWLAAFGGGLLTVFTAAFKLRVVEAHFPFFVEGFLIGTNYAVSFLLMQIFGLALATKQPSMTAAALAGLVRDNRGISRWSKIADFAARIMRTQLAAAIGNVIAVCLGAVAFEHLWRLIFLKSYLADPTAKHVYETLHPFTSGTAIFAALTGIILWAAAVIGGWCENFAIYNRVPEAIAQHPLGQRFGVLRMQRLADWFERNVGAWSTSIILGYMMGLVPEIARFFGIPLDVRHVTLSTGTLALAAARYGTSAFGYHWFYFAVAGLSLTFVLNLGVSFAIASITALRAYNVLRPEQLRILRYVFGEFIHSPLRFFLPVKDKGNEEAHGMSEATD